MSDELSLGLRKLLIIEDIKRLKYAYLRMLDLKLWDELGALFTDDVITSYGDGKHVYSGREAVITFLRGALGDPGIVTMHQVHHPEIVVRDDFQSAEGIWYLNDRVINTGVGPMAGTKGFTLEGSAFYHEVYERRDGTWKIHRIGYERVYQETVSRGEFGRMAWKSRFEPRS